MSADDIPEVAAEITFLTPEEGGRSRPVDLSAGRYRPHLVIGDPSQRQAILRDGNVINEEYLGVQFKPTQTRCEPGEPQTFTLQLMYHPRVSYDRLVPGATFTVREGARVVAFALGERLAREEKVATILESDPIWQNRAIAMEDERDLTRWVVLVSRVLMQRVLPLGWPS